MEKVIQPLSPASSPDEPQSQSAKTPEPPAVPEVAPDTQSPVLHIALPATPTISSSTPEATAPPMTPYAADLSSSNDTKPTLPQKLGHHDEFPVGVAASSLNIKTKPPMPKGVYVIAAVLLVIFVASFFSSDTSLVYVINMVINLLLAVGLILRQELARKAMIIIQALTVVLTSFIIVGLFMLQARVHQLRTQADQAIARVEATNRVTPSQKAEIAQVKAQLASQEEQLGQRYKVAYVVYGVTIVVNLGIIGYLTRPKVKEAFQQG